MYDNIIWVSAKRDFYDYIFDTIESRDPQIESLDNILLAILRFFDLEDLEEYNSEDRKELALELLKSNKVLLILDNFETITKPDNREKILEFFGTDVKRILRSKPGNFKIILTSREQIRTGFRQIELNGLEYQESRKLMASLFKRYKSNHTELNGESEKGFI